MGPLAMLNHALNFAAPALWLALWMPLLARIFIRKKPVAIALPVQVAIHLIVGLVTLALGLVVFGRDGKMLTYLALVLLMGTSQWVMFKGGRAGKNPPGR